MTRDIAVGFLLAFAVSVLLGTPLIRLLKRFGVRQTVSEDAPTRHQVKQGTPTMGGLLILAGLALPVLFVAIDTPNPSSVWVLLGLTLAGGLIGIVDDFLIVSRGKNQGLKARQKLVLQFLPAIAFVLWLYMNASSGRTTVLRVLPGMNPIDLGFAYYLLGVLFIVGLCNAINLVDGLDGLAGGVSAIVALAAALTVQTTFGYAWLPLFGGALAGGCAGFLWFNVYPAQVFMGNTGSTALGAAMAGIAMLGKIEVPFQLYAVVPWAGLLSVVIQVLVFKYRRLRYGLEYAKVHRVFRRTPLHHHFEELGWPEAKIVQRFWLATGLGVAAGLLLIG